MICPICGHHVEDADYWAGDQCLRCALQAEMASPRAPDRPRQEPAALCLGTGAAGRQPGPGTGRNWTRRISGMRKTLRLYLLTFRANVV